MRPTLRWFESCAPSDTGLWRRRGVSPKQARGAFNADPWAVLVRDGQLPCKPHTALELMTDLALWTSQHYPRVTAVRVGTAPYHHAGANAVQDIAFGIATGVQYLRAMTGAGMSLDDAARQIVFSFSLGTRHFLAIAKLRAEIAAKTVRQVAEAKPVAVVDRGAANEY